MTRRAGAVPLGGVEPHARRSAGLVRRAVVIGMSAGACGLFGASAATAAPAPAFTEVAGSPFVTGNSPESVAFSPDGGLIVSANSGEGDNLSVFSVSSSGGLSEVPGSPVQTGNDPDAVAFSPNGELLANANEEDDTVSMFAVSPAGGLTEVPGSPFPTGSDPVSVAFSPGGGFLATGNDNDDTVSMFAVSPAGGLTEVPGSPFPTGSDPVAVAFSSDGGWLATANDNDDTVSMFAVSPAGGLTEVPGSPVATGNDPVAVAFSPSGGLLATTNQIDNTISTFAVSPSGALNQVPGSPFATGNSPTWAAFSPSGGLLATANQGDNTSSVFSVSSSGALSEVAGSPYATGAGPDAVTLNPRGLIAIANQADSTLSMFSVGPPAAVINAPADAGTYRLNQQVATSFSCTDGADAPGISACTDSNGASGNAGLLNTKIAGLYTYTVTAASGDGQRATTAIKYAVLTATGTAPTAKDCPRATGRLHGATLGRVALGMTRAQARQRYQQSSRHGSRFEDVFCLTPSGVSVGYASNPLLTTLSAKARAKLRGRVVVVVSADPIYALHGIRPGSTLRAAAKRLHTGAVIHVGASNWYMAREGSTTGVIEVRQGIVREVGVANAKLTDSRKTQLRFIKRAF
jgi:6-phosphogluconolactonase (cycloisomerase 2 family)